MSNIEKRSSKSAQKNGDDVIISCSSFFSKLKKYFLPWLIIAALSALIIVGITTVANGSTRSNVSAVVSFNYDGIENGKAPDGNKFQISDMKKPEIVEAALKKLDLPLDNVDAIRQGITFNSIRPNDMIDQITDYDSIYKNVIGDDYTVTDKVLENKYYSTQYKISFNFSNTGLSGSQAVDVINTMLDCYNDYFYSNYGYNATLANAVTNIDYNTYDYAEALDVYSDTLSTLRKYITSLSNKDTTRFCSEETGYTFSDLSKALSVIEDIEIDKISSYISVNNVTKDKDSLANYYRFRIQSLERSKTVYQEELAAITDMIENFQKDDVLIIGSNNEDVSTKLTQTSGEYDKLLERKLNAQSNFSTAVQQIAYYNERITMLNTSAVGSHDKLERVESDISALDERIRDLINDIEITTEEYYRTVALKNGYSVLSPANRSIVAIVKQMISSSLMPLITVEAMIFVIFLIIICADALGYSFKFKRPAGGAKKNKNK